MKLEPIERYFRRRGYRARLRASTLAAYWNDFVEEMEKRGYRRYTTYRSVEVSLALSEYAARQGVRSAAALLDDVVARYLRRRGTPRDAQRHVRHILDFLRERGALRPPSSQQPVALPPLVDEYTRFLREHRGTCERTIAAHRAHVAGFLQSLGAAGSVTGMACLPPASVHAFVMTRSAELTRASRKRLCAALRMFFRFLLLAGYATEDMASWVPVIPSYKLDRLPRAIAWKDIQKILAVVNRKTAIGRRDYALFLMLATYGIRIGQLCAMTLDDIDWPRQTIKVRAAKGGRDTVLPLRRSVSQALLAYFRGGRPRGRHREIFLRVQAPIGPLSGNVTAQIRPYARRAGVEPPYGPHAWRHACATRMLASGHPLKTIRDILGHTSIESTFIYTKVDVDTVRNAALEWPLGTA